jgi:hemerythrin-like metal-binding protein
MEAMSQVNDLSVRMIGRDHQEIAEILLEINFNANKGGDVSERTRRLKELMRITRSHFTLEEGMMAAANYPGLGIHALRHEWMLDQIRRTDEYWNRRSDALLTREPLGLLWESHIVHSENEDRAFGVWMTEGSGTILAPGRQLAAGPGK